ncbi:twitching motility protein PilT [Thalassospira sp. HJ]|uniref:type II toxin-antitoxin system VapC family toxin n=1 Tax=Thalassospira sp. HJ TaxID=1616823 RepID=UPI0005CEC53A|nr:type II toxin-antitoxin system VapC family toxin [Thalassospira sp. HJ]KJE36062.1 twitching motility protein PilT [Thalassospira sp. HJ]
MFILDTNVVSELRRAGQGKANQNVVSWAQSVDVTSLYISVITVLEIEAGILQVERRDTQQATVLRNWFEHHVLKAFENRILPIDEAVARRCAQLHVPDPKSERDAMIAASALVHGMTVVTRNTKDFDQTGVPLLDPWS